MTQLCLAMADLILLMPEWTNALSELMAKLSGSPTSVPALLEVLLLLPEEVDSRHLRLGSNRRSQIKQMLSLSAPHIAQFLQSVLLEEASTVARQVSVVKCYSSWITLGCIQLSSVQACRLMLPKNQKKTKILFTFFLQASPVMGLAVSALSSPRSAPPLHEASADCMIALLTRIEREECSELEVRWSERFFNSLVAGEHSGHGVHDGGELPACSD